MLGLYDGSILFTHGNTIKFELFEPNLIISKNLIFKPNLYFWLIVSMSAI